jgi:hypothetical protein
MSQDFAFHPTIHGFHGGKAIIRRCHRTNNPAVHLSWKTNGPPRYAQAEADEEPWTEESKRRLI